MKVYNSEIVFREFPDEITLALNISNCPCFCKGCHSQYLAENKGDEITEEWMRGILSRGALLTCVGIMGGDAYPHDVVRWAKWIKENTPLKVGWYSGRDSLNEVVAMNLKFFDYIKIGHYDEQFGGLDSPTTNQKFYKVVNQQIGDIGKACILKNITAKFWKNKEEY